MNEMISVVIPSYNREKTIIECLESVLNQSYENIEVIIVDDASEDNTYKLFENYHDPRVRYVKYKENKGACYARNLGASLAKGTYIAFQDSDDIWEKDKLKKQLLKMQDGNYDFVFCGMDRVDPVNGGHYYYPNLRFDENGDALGQFLYVNYASTQTIMVKKSIMENVKFDVSFKRFQDWDFSLQAIIAGCKIGYLEEALVSSTVQNNSISARVKEGPAYEHYYEKYKKYWFKSTY